MEHKKLFQKDFTMVIIGQIISLFGNSILRYALPLYLLNQTHSAGLFGIVSACSLLPMILLSPIGGIIADRINKRNVMVILDFSTSILILILVVLLDRVNIIVLLITVLMILYGIQGTYQPTVQASVPLLVDGENLMAGNASITLVNSLAGLIGPVLGGIMFAAIGIKPILYLSIICFLISAIMEIFIHIPFTRENTTDTVLMIVKKDMADSFSFIRHDQPILIKVTILIAFINMVFSALIMIGVPIIVNEKLAFPQEQGNRLYGYAQGALAAGGLSGGLLAGVIGKKLSIKKSYLLISLCTFTLLPIGIALLLPLSPIVSYLIIIISCTIMMICSSIFSIEMISCAQILTPAHLLGKVMALISCFVICAHPIGQLIYGSLFEFVSVHYAYIFFGAFLICLAISNVSKRILTAIPIEDHL